MGLGLAYEISTMNHDQLVVRRAAKNGELDTVDPAFLVPENLLYPHPKGHLMVLPEADGPIQNAARHGQLSFLPPEARSVRALLDCGHPLRAETARLGIYEDAFYAAAVRGALGEIPGDENFKTDLGKYRYEIEASINRAEKYLRDQQEIGKPIPENAFIKDLPSYAEAADMAHDWIDTLCFYHETFAKTPAALPPIASVPRDLPSRLPEGGAGVTL
jgi:hypothetical protein